MGKIGSGTSSFSCLIMVLLDVALFGGILCAVAAQDGQTMSAEEKSKIRYLVCFSVPLPLYFYFVAFDSKLRLLTTPFSAITVCRVQERISCRNVPSKGCALKVKSTLNGFKYASVDKNDDVFSG